MDGRDVFLGVMFAIGIATVACTLSKIDNVEKENSLVEISDAEYARVNNISHYFSDEVRQRLSDGKIDRREFEELKKMDSDRLDESMRKMKRQLLEKYSAEGSQ